MYAFQVSFSHQRVAPACPPDHLASLDGVHDNSTFERCLSDDLSPFHTYMHVSYVVLYNEIIFYPIELVCIELKHQ